jgi:predicted glycoside hydrolase/deacetylase ChbG (UPF0249 family)
MSESGSATTNRLLGYPADARLLIINADDFGMCHAVNMAITQSLRDGVVCSTSLMTPCAWALHAMDWLSQNPDVSFAVHLTLVAEQQHYKWGPLSGRDRVSSLVNEAGYFYEYGRMDAMVQQAALDEVETEFRAQIEAVLRQGLKPTHLDWHCLRNGGRADVFDLTVRLAREYGLAVRAYDQPWLDQLNQQGLPAINYSLLDSYRLERTDKAARYAQLLRELPPGLSEWAVHPGIGNDEMRAVEAGSWPVRQTDFDFVMSPEAREIIQQEGIILLDYKPLQQVWQSTH